MRQFAIQSGFADFGMEIWHMAEIKQLFQSDAENPIQK
jgi:hypothetical protein